MHLPKGYFLKKTMVNEAQGGIWPFGLIVGMQ